ncbi:M48 family metallopeptidase [Ilumatobacteraceae bacterium]|nr:M48 family metallopeptidase [Ilumatobacteraceae bacterium]
MNEIIRSNRRRSAALVLGFIVGTVAIGAVAGWLVGGGWTVTVVAAVVALVGSITAWWSSASVALAVSRAYPADEQQYRRLHNVVEGLCIAAGLPKPRIYIVDDPAPNAFATGRNPNHAAIAVTTGLLQQMNRVELEGVIAHELSHIRHYDITVSTIAVTLVGTLALISDLSIRTMWWNGGRRSRGGDRSDRFNPLAIVGLVLIVLAPLIARLLQAAVSRSRESLADLGACQLTRYPPGLIAALEKLQSDTTATHSATTATAHLWIEQPMSGLGDDGRLGSLHRLFDTHPPLAERINTLREL